MKFGGKGKRQKCGNFVTYIDSATLLIRQNEKLTTKVSIFYIFINRGRCRFSLVLMLELFIFVDEWVQNHDILLFWQARPVVHVFQVKTGAHV